MKISVPIKENNKRTIIFMSLVVFLVIVFIYTVDLNIVFTQLKQVDIYHFSIALVALAIGLFFYSLRWQTLLKNRVGFWRVFHIANFGLMVNIIAPYNAGEAARIFTLGKSPEFSVPEITSSVIAERWMEQVMRSLVLTIAITFGLGVSISWKLIAGVLLLLGLFLWLVLILVKHREKVLDVLPLPLSKLPYVTEFRAREAISRFLVGFLAVSSTKCLAKAFVWSLFAWLCFFIFHYQALISLGLSGNPNLLAISLGALAIAPPSATAMPGIFHASLVAPFVLTGYNKESITAYAVILQSIHMLLMFPLGLQGLKQINKT